MLCMRDIFSRYKRFQNWESEKFAGPCPNSAALRNSERSAAGGR